MKVRVFTMTEKAKQNHYDWDDAISQNEITTVETIKMIDGENVNDYMSMFYPQYEDDDKYGYEIID